MLRSLMLLSVAVLLTACQTNAPLADFDVSRDFSQYHTWTWADPAVEYAPAGDPRLPSDLTTQRVKEAVSAQLDVRGLRPASNNTEADLQVRTSVVMETRRDQVTTQFGGFWGYGGPYWGGGPGYTQTRSVDYQVLTLQIDMLDGQDGRLIWRGNAGEKVRDRSPIERTQEMHQLAARVLANFPPN